MQVGVLFCPQESSYTRASYGLTVFRISCIFNPGIQLRHHFIDLAVFPFRGANNGVPGDVEAVIQGGPRKLPTLKAGGYQIPLQYADSVS